MRPFPTDVDERLWTIFESALEQPEDRRRDFVREACRGDGELRGALEELLEADARDGCFFDQPLVEGEERSAGETGEPTTPTGPALRAEPAVRQVGPYRLVEKIGEGGMGIAYRAERDDRAFERSVVVKIARRGPGDRERMRRLRIERRILARLEHPYIARLYDGGTTDDGHPYFVMEQVEGEPIDAYCERHRLPVAARLALFRKVCEAVRHAHRNLVVHRDLKPSNILVTPRGEPKLLDFGIAKLLDPEPAGEEGEQTTPWQRALTPRYASPEQLRGEPVTTASDVYSLGVLLYKILTGTLPHDFKAGSLSEIVRRVEEEPPATPSSVAAGEASRRLRGDLDLILLKALRPDPESRYPSVERLDEDLARHQQGLPVSARPETWLYLGGKFVRRHWPAVTAAVSFLLLLLIFAGAMAWQSARVARQRDLVTAERDKAEATLGFLRTILRFDDPKTDSENRGEVTLREAVERVRPDLERLRLEQPEVGSTLYQELGVINGHLGRYEPARELLEKALETRQSHPGDRHPELAVAGVRLDLADVLKELDELEAAEDHARQALAAFRRHLDAGSPALTRPLNHLVSVLCWGTDYERAEPLADEAATLARQLPADDPERPGALNNLAAVRSALGDPASAVELYRESIELLRSGWGDTHPYLPALLNNLGVELRQLGDLGGTEAAYREALRLQLLSLGEDHPDLTPNYFNWARALHDNGAYDEAVETYSQALRILYGIDGGPPARWTLLAEASRALSQAHVGEPRRAADHLHRQLELWRPRLDAERSRALLARVESMLGEVLLLAGDFRRAEELLVASYRQLLEHGKPRHQEEARRRLERLEEKLGVHRHPEEPSGSAPDQI